MLEEVASWERRESAVAEPSETSWATKSTPLAKNQPGRGLAASQFPLRAASNSNGSS